MFKIISILVYVTCIIYGLIQGIYNIPAFGVDFWVWIVISLISGVLSLTLDF